ncbi:signal peptidase I [Demequina muriae]|uniref:Signal peptidase I n=1 Tax=Demequina muriae TaxID=3051664 RepID=A0ABT8GFB8_9MICO|nr:signal peptidase I [Demequina sp. EGI L300058]MDN4480123.1 signal peptidase I [Demequina sp. EGI L300058]
MAAMLDASTDATRVRRYWRVLVQGLSWVLLAIAVYALWPASLGGGTSLVIVSGQSMEPTYSSGDLVVARKGDPQIGDVIIYAPEDLGGAQVVHRIIGGDAASGWVLQGDNNDFIDPFYPAGAEVRGIVHLHVPNAGVVTMWLLNPLLWCGVILLAMVIALWPSAGDEDDDEPEDGAEDGADDEAADQAAPVTLNDAKTSGA